MDIKEQIKSKINFIIIGLVSLIGMGIIPFLASSIDADSDEDIIKNCFPTTKLGWVMWAIFRGTIIIINIFIFIAFVNQGKMNCKDNVEYQKSEKKWIEIQVWKGKNKKKHEKVYLTPKQHYASVYSKKGLMISIWTFASLFSVTYIVLNWDLITFLSITITIILAMIFGLLSMYKEEYYWLNDFKIRCDIEYDKMIKTIESNKEVNEDVTI